MRKRRLLVSTRKNLKIPKLSCLKQLNRIRDLRDAALRGLESSLHAAQQVCNVCRHGPWEYVIRGEVLPGTFSHAANEIAGGLDFIFGVHELILPRSTKVFVHGIDHHRSNSALSRHAGPAANAWSQTGWLDYALGHEPAFKSGSPPNAVAQQGRVP